MVMGSHLIYMLSIDDKIKIKFYKVGATTKNGKKPNYSEGWRVNGIIGLLVAKKLGLKPKDKVSIAIDEDNPFYWQIKKSTFGYSLGEHSKHLGFSLKWDKKIPANHGVAFYASWEIVDGAIELKFCQEEIREGRFL